MRLILKRKFYSRRFLYLLIFGQNGVARKMLAPVLEEIASQKADIKIAKINVDANMSLAQDYKVVSIPMLLLFKDGEVVKKTVGALPKSELLAFIEQE